MAIPCPKKIWRERARRKMLSCLPLVGCIVGGVWVLCACLAQWLPKPLAAWTVPPRKEARAITGIAAIEIPPFPILDCDPPDPAEKGRPRRRG